jgi:chromosome segregation and condensation protein ScpB
MTRTAQKTFETFHLYTDEAIDSPFVKALVERMKCSNLDQLEEAFQDRYIDEWAEEAVCLVHVNNSHRILLHCGMAPIYNRYRKQQDH